MSAVSLERASSVERRASSMLERGSLDIEEEKNVFRFLLSLSHRHTYTLYVFHLTTLDSLYSLVDIDVNFFFFYELSNIVIFIPDEVFFLYN